MVERSRDVDELRQTAGRVILDLTDRFGFDAFAAGWMHDRTNGSWRYLLVTPMLATHGPGWVYDRLLRLFRLKPLPAGISPLDIHVIDPAMEEAALGPPFLEVDERLAPPGIRILLTHDVRLGDFAIDDGFVALYRRLPVEQRKRKSDPARRFDLKVRQLEAAA